VGTRRLTAKPIFASSLNWNEQNLVSFLHSLEQCFIRMEEKVEKEEE